MRRVTSFGTGFESAARNYNVKLARVYMAEKKPAEAVALYELAVPILQQSGPSERELLLYSLKNEAVMLEELHRDADRIRVQGQIDAIENIKSQSVDPRVQWQALMDLAMHSTNHPDQRLGWLREALTSAERLGPSAELSQTLSMLAGESIKEPEEGVAYLKRALTVNQQVFGKSSIQVAEVYGHLAFLYGVEKKEADEEASAKQQIAVLEKVPRAQSQLSAAEQNLGFLYDVQKRQPEAESAYLSSIRTAESIQPKNDNLVLTPVQRLALHYKNWEKYDQAVTYFTRAVEIEKASPRPNPILVSDLENLSDLLRKLGRSEEAQRYDEERKEAIDRLAKLMTGSPTK